MNTQESIIITCLANQLDKRGAANIKILEGKHIGVDSYIIRFDYDELVFSYPVFKSYVKRYGAFMTIKNIFKELKLK